MPKKNFSNTEKVELVLASMKEGIVVKSFCAQHKISRSSYYTWKKDLLNHLSQGINSTAKRSRPKAGKF